MNDLKKYSPQYVHINDTLAFVVHLSFLQQNCKLIGLNEEQYLADLGSVPQGWNKSNEIYQFRYILKSKQHKDEQKENENKKKNTILVKILSMDKHQLLITAVKQGSNDVYTLEINLNDHIDTLKASKDLTDYPSIYKDIDGLLILLNDQITNKIIPQKQKPSHEDDKKKKKKPSNDPNPLIFPDPNNNRNPLLIGGGRGGIGGIPYGGGFGGDMDPFGGNGGNLMGPNQINQQWRNRNDPNGNNGNRPPLVPPNARFDPFGPGRDFPSGPDPNHFKPPGGGFGGGGGLGGFGGII